jgi:hypothetical protein
LRGLVGGSWVPRASTAMQRGADRASARRDGIPGQVASQDDIPDMGELDVEALTREVFGPGKTAIDVGFREDPHRGGVSSEGNAEISLCSTPRTARNEGPQAQAEEKQRRHDSGILHAYVCCDGRLLEGGAGKGVVNGLVAKVEELSTDAVLGKIIPHNGWGVWPHLPAHADEFQSLTSRCPPEQAKIWGPQSWGPQSSKEGSFPDQRQPGMAENDLQLYLMNCATLVVLMVHAQGHQGKGCEHLALGLNLENDAVDPVLLTWIVAVELKEMARSSVRAVFPIFTKGKNLHEALELRHLVGEDRGDSKEKTTLLWCLPHTKTAEYAVEFLLTVDRHLSECDQDRIRSRSVRDTFMELLKNQVCVRVCVCMSFVCMRA